MEVVVILGLCGVVALGVGFLALLLIEHRVARIQKDVAAIRESLE